MLPIWKSLGLHTCGAKVWRCGQLERNVKSMGSTRWSTGRHFAARWYWTRF
uniref:Uncharacterized protein n=1 Tax=Romanomermis culicivorax TaxID=13658 RepID=A0A915KCY6_ROMCU